MNDTNIFRTQAKVLKALAHETRLRIVDRLSSGDCTAGELVTLVGSDASTVSRHLSVLKSVGILDDRRVGSAVIYHLVTPCVVSFFGCATRVMEERVSGQV
jgi:ArsR family transcriptional regulator